jgi:hypothetical protein
MGASHFNARRYWTLLIVGAILTASFYGCRHLIGSGSSEDKKLTVLDPRCQPSGKFGRRGAPDSQMMAIFNPETHPTISRDELVSIRMAPRLQSLDTKTIYLVDTGCAGAREFLVELQAWFARNMPSVKTTLVSKKGTMFSDSPDLWAELKKKADGVIFGVGGRDGCSASLAEFARTLEGEYGVPTAPIVTARFAGYVIRDGHLHGMNLRWSFPPYPVAWVSRETLRQYVQGNDPVTGVKLTTEIIDALTKPLTDAEKNPEITKKPKRPRMLEPDLETNLQQTFLRNEWTDGLPIVLPTEERVTEMLTGTDHDPQEVVGMMSVVTHEEMKEYTVEKVAINAVMAGARPEHLPVILAIASTQHPAMPSFSSRG